MSRHVSRQVPPYSASLCRKGGGGGGEKASAGSERGDGDPRTRGWGAVKGARLVARAIFTILLGRATWEESLFPELEHKASAWWTVLFQCTVFPLCTYTLPESCYQPSSLPGDVPSQEESSISIVFSAHRLHGYGMAEDFSYVYLSPNPVRSLSLSHLLSSTNSPLSLTRPPLSLANVYWDRSQCETTRVWYRKGPKVEDKRWRDVGSHWLKTIGLTYHQNHIIRIQFDIDASSNLPNTEVLFNYSCGWLLQPAHY